MNKESSLFKIDFILLMFGKLVSLMGTKMQNFALGIYVLGVTESATKFASVLAIGVLPRLILGPAAGVLIDWFDRKKIIVSMDVIRGIITGIFAVVFFVNGELSMTSIYILVISLAMASIMFEPAIMTVIPGIVKKEEYMAANSVNSIIMNIGLLAGPALGATVLGFFGIQFILVLNAVSFVLSGISEMFINIPKVVNKKEKSFKVFKEDFIFGLKFIKNSKFIIMVIWLSCIMNLASAAFGSLGVTYIAKEILMLSDVQFGIIESLSVGAMLIAPLLATRITKNISVKKLIFYAMISFSGIVAFMALIPSPFFLKLTGNKIIPVISLIAVSFLIGCVMTMIELSIGTILQQEIPLEVMGRVQTARITLCMSTTPIGHMIFGVLMDKIPVWQCLLLAAMILFVGTMFQKKLIYSVDYSKNSSALAE